MLHAQPHRAVHLGALAAAAPDQVGFEADIGVTAPRRPTLDRLQQEAVALPFGELHHRRHRRF